MSLKIRKKIYNQHDKNLMYGGKFDSNYVQKH